jgi:hypothetical protein
VIGRFADRLGLALAGLLVGALAAACGAAPVEIHPAATVTKSVQYVDPQGWSVRYPSSLTLEHSTSGPGVATFTEVTVANFAQRRAVVTGKTRDGGFILVRPPLDRAGRFPADGVAFRMLLVDGGPAPIGTVADSRFPIRLSTFTRPQYGDFSLKDYTALGVPHELARPIDADGQHYEALVLIGPAASASERAAIRAVIASLTFPRLHTGEQAGDETVLDLASRYPVGSFTLIHAPGELCAGSVYRCHAGSQPFYLVHAPGRLHQPDLIDPCEPTPAACAPPGAFYALGWTSEDVLGGYRSACDLRFDRRLEQFWCTNSSARWDRTGRVIRRPPGARFDDGLQFAFAKIAWDGHVVFLAGLGGNAPRDPARSLLWPESQYSANGISFDYPADWHARTYPEFSDFTAWLVWLSPQRMHPPCVTRRGTHNTTITCSEPLERLRPDSILASWTTNGMPGWSFSRAPGIPITVGGRRGKWLSQTGSYGAPSIGENKVITVVVPTPGTSDIWYQLTAFLRGPDTRSLEQQIRTMLGSVQWLTADPTS